MATLLKSKLSREFPIALDHHNRNIVIELEPNGVVTFRQKGLKSKISVGIKWLYQQAQMRDHLPETTKPKKAKRGLLSI